MAWQAASFDVAQRSGVPAYRVSEFKERASAGMLVIPVINEGDRILGQLTQIFRLALGLDVVIADGGSSDGSMEPSALASMGVTSLLTLTSQGRLSTQLRMGFDYALRNKAPWTVTMDGNGKDAVTGIETMVGAMEAGFDFVQGSRFVPGGVAENTPWLRYMAIRSIHAPLSSLAAGTHFTDTTNGFRGHSARFLADERLSPFRDVFVGYELLAYMPIQAGRLGVASCEVPVARRYPRGSATPTKIDGVRGNLDLFRVLMRAVTGRYAPSQSEMETARYRDWPPPSAKDT